MRPRILHLAHHTPVAGHPGITRQYYTMRRQWYWPSMAADIRKVSHNCHACAQERIKLRAHQSPLKLFPATTPLEYIAIDILGPLKRASTGDQYLLIISDRFSKLTRAIPLRSITALSVAKAFVNNWVVPYGAPATLLSDNGSQFTSKLFTMICSELKIRNAFTTAYHPQTNGQVERYNRTILAGLRAFVAEHPRSWPHYAQLLTYAYNTQVHPTTGVALFELILSNPPKPLTIRREPSHKDAVEPRRLQDQFQNAMKILQARAVKQMHRAQSRYKRNFDKSIRPLQPAGAGDWVYIAREGGREEEDGIKTRHKLQAPAEGPYEVTSADNHTLTIRRSRGLIKTVSRDRCITAPVPARGDTATATSSSSLGSSSVDVHGRRPRPPPTVPTEEASLEPNLDQSGGTERYTVSRVADYDARSQKFRIQWHGYHGEDTWEPPQNLPYNLIIDYFHRKRKAVPKGIRASKPRS